jgi:hypothetical protein
MNPNPTDKDRLAHFATVEMAVGALRLPLMDQRKLNGIMNAIEMQLESDHYSPEAIDYLLRALQAAVLHEVSDGRETAVVQAIDIFVENGS